VNHSMYSADRNTHLKIVVVGLLGALLVTAVGIFGRALAVDLGTVPVVKATQSTAISGSFRTIR
jgi:hypothetical protein